MGERHISVWQDVRPATPGEVARWFGMTAKRCRHRWVGVVRRWEDADGLHITVRKECEKCGKVQR